MQRREAWMVSDPVCWTTLFVQVPYVFDQVIAFVLVSLGFRRQHHVPCRRPAQHGVVGVTTDVVRIDHDTVQVPHLEYPVACERHPAILMFTVDVSDPSCGYRNCIGFPPEPRVFERGFDVARCRLPCPVWALRPFWVWRLVVFEKSHGTETSLSHGANGLYRPGSSLISQQADVSVSASPLLAQVKVGQNDVGFPIQKWHYNQHTSVGPVDVACQFLIGS